MTPPQKVKAGAGAEWLLGGFGLLKKAPLALGLVGLVFAIVSILPALFAAAGIGVMLAAQLAVILVTPVLLGGMVHAVAEVDQGRAASPGQLLQGFREGKALALIAQLVPQLLAGVVILLLLVVLVGPTGLQTLMQVAEQSQSQATPDPALYEAIPAGGLLLWLLLSIVVGVLAYAFTFLLPAQVMFEGRRPFEAMKRSFRACIGNIPAFLVFVVLLLIVAGLISVGAHLLAAILRLVAGPVAMQVAGQLLMMAVLLPVLSGASYFAWRQLLGGPVGTDVGEPAPASPASGIEV